jgi:hypothetical protein
MKTPSVPGQGESGKPLLEHASETGLDTSKNESRKNLYEYVASFSCCPGNS